MPPRYRRLSGLSNRTLVLRDTLNRKAPNVRMRTPETWGPPCSMIGVPRVARECGYSGTQGRRFARYQTVGPWRL